MCIRDSDKTPRWVCAWLEVAARVRNPHGEGWGKLVNFTDPDRTPKRRIIADTLLSGDGIELERSLRDAGLHISPTGRPLLRQYLIEAAPKARARITNRTGSVSYTHLHRSYARTGEPVGLNFQNRGGNVPPYQARQLVAMMDKYEAIP